eukprot:1894089-Amphidinium_carterae.1
MDRYLARPGHNLHFILPPLLFVGITLVLYKVTRVCCVCCLVRQLLDLASSGEILGYRGNAPESCV